MPYKIHKEGWGEISYAQISDPNTVPTYFYVVLYLTLCLVLNLNFTHLLVKKKTTFATVGLKFRSAAQLNDSETEFKKLIFGDVLQTFHKFPPYVLALFLHLLLPQPPSFLFPCR